MKDNDEQTPFLAAVASGSTDVVMSLFMWRGNNHVKISSKSIPCSLSWAVKTRNVDMVMLLLEFNDPCGRGYDLARALRVALEGSEVVMDHDDYDTLELCRVLVQAGANPCDSSGESGLVMAVKKRDSRTLATLIDSYDCRLQEMRTERCKDPVLQKQPASFFAGMDSRESAERSSSLREALVTALFDFHVAATESASKSFLCAQVLFQRGAELGTSGLSRLKRSITLRSLQDNTFSSDFIDRQFIYRVAHLDIETIGVNANNEMQWSMAMLHMPWMTSADVKSSSCQFVKTNVNRGSFSRPDVIIKADDGKRFAAHASILSEKSEKLAAAVHFHLMSKQESDMLEIHLDASSELCLFFLQHIYHGSMLKLEVLNKDPVRIVHSILDLLILADEYIVPSLTQECVMRLLSKDICQCFCRSCTKTVYDQSLSCYQACGPTVCLTTDTCLDILAVTQHIRQGDLPCTSSLSVLWEEPTLWGPADKHEMSVDPLDALSEAVHRYILLHYGELLESDSFKEHCCDSQLKEVSSRERAQEFLLLCLGQCAISPIGVYEIRSVSLTAVAAGDPLVEQLLPTRVCNGSSRQEPEPSRNQLNQHLDR
ncbi:hypothetical protein MPSEU_000160100 [Mayamaea pseudoterrestris]|nr:hypothetical protein MPSEU_000160100 [Mayamaea pseudoterrestris]